MSNEDKLKETVFFVEANDNERHQIWRDLHEKRLYEHDSMGFAVHVGNVKDDPSMQVWVTFLFSYLDDYRICMYNATSRFVDHIMVENYIKSKYLIMWNNSHKTAMCDANNFHLCRNAIDDLVEQRIKQNATTA